MILPFHSTLRRLTAEPRFSIPVVLTLALGMAMAGVAVGLLRHLLWAEPAVHAPQRLLAITFQRDGGSPQQLSGPQARALFDAAPQLQASAAVYADAGTATSFVAGGRSEVLPAVFASAQIVAVLGAELVRGTSPAEDARDSVLLSAAALDRLGIGLDAAVGSRIRVNGQDRMVSGVFPDGRLFPKPVDAILPLDIRERERLDPGQNTGVFMRLPDNVDRATFSSQLAAFSDHLRRATPALLAERSQLIAYAASDVIGGRLRAATQALANLLIGLAAAISVLVIGTLAILQYARVLRRHGETEVRCAFGARRRDLIGLRIADAMFLLLPALALATVFGLVLLHRVREPMQSLGGIGALQADATGALTGLLLGLVYIGFGLILPGIGRVTDGTALRERNAISGLSWQRVLVIVQVAIATTTLVGFGVLWQSMLRLQAQALGFERTGIQTATVALTAAGYRDASTATQRTEHLVRTLRDQLAALPGVPQVALSSSLPLQNGLNNYFEVPRPGEAFGASAEMRVIAGDYFQILGVAVLRGSDLRASFPEESTPVVINQRFAELFFPGLDPVGQRLGADGQGGVIVGVVADMRDVSLDTPPTPTAYLRHQDVDAPLQSLINTWFQTSVLIRSRSGSVSAALLTDTLRQVDADLAWSRFADLEQVIAESTRFESFLTQSIAALALFALALAAFGLFSTLHYLQSLRRKELAMRLALGASPAGLARLVFQRAARWGLAGVALGMLGTLAARETIEKFAFQTPATDPLLLTLGSAGALLIVALAALGPIREVLKIEVRTSIGP